MKTPWITRSSHQAMVTLLSEEIAELKSERRLLLDRLAVLGLGAPLYAGNSEASIDGKAQGAKDKGPQAENEASLEEETMDTLLRLRRRPGRLADVLTRSMRREQGRRPAGPRVAWISQGDAVSAALDQAEEAGRRNYSPS